MFVSMDWFKGKITGKPHISLENLWFPANFPLNQSIVYIIVKFYTQYDTNIYQY